MRPEDVRLGEPYRVDVAIRGEAQTARFVPVERLGSTPWGPIFLGHLYLGGKRETDVRPWRFLADEMDPWSGQPPDARRRRSDGLHSP